MFIIRDAEQFARYAPEKICDMTNSCMVMGFIRMVTGFIPEQVGERDGLPVHKHLILNQSDPLPLDPSPTPEMPNRHTGGKSGAQHITSSIA